MRMMVKALGMFMFNRFRPLVLVCAAMQVIIDLLSHGSTNASDFFQLIDVGIGNSLGAAEVPEQLPAPLCTDPLDTFQ